MDFGWNSEQQALREEVRKFIAEEVDQEKLAAASGEEGGRNPYVMELREKIKEKKWVAIAWPKEYGGQDRDQLTQYLVDEEFTRIGMQIGLAGGTGAAIMAAGTQEQKDYYLPRLISGEISFAQGFTEPSGGADLASLQTRAVRDGDFYVINGQKTFTSLADHADFINLDDPIPIYLAATGPKAMGVVGELGDGWVTSGGGPWIAEGFPIIEAGAESVGRAYSKPYTVVLEGACVLHEGETMDSERVIQRVGPWAILNLHTMWESSHGHYGSNLPVSDADLAAQYHRYISDYAESKGHPTDRLYLDVHEGHYSYLKDGEVHFVDPDRIARAVTGTGPEIIGKLEQLESFGVDHIALSAHSRDGARELIADFGREVIAKTAG